jgi:hypothetical protein
VPTPPGIFCLEGDWSRSIASRQSVEPLMRLLEDCGAARYVHRDVATRAELNFYIERWLRLARTKYPIGYFGFHGSSRTLHLSRSESMDLDELASQLGSRCSGRILYFGACSTLAVPDVVLMDFCSTTKAKGVVGYTKDVDFAESAGFEIHLLMDLLHASSFKPAYQRLCNNHPVLSKRLGLRMASATWASPRSVALEAARAK